MDRNDEINQPKEDSLEERPAEEDELNDAPEFSQEEVEYLSSSEASPIVSIERDALAAAEAAESQAQMLRDWPVWLVASLTLLSGLAGSVQPLAARLANHPKLFFASGSNRVLPLDQIVERRIRFVSYLSIIQSVQKETSCLVARVDCFAPDSTSALR